MYTAHCNFMVMLGSEDVPIRVRSLMDVLMVQLQSTALAAANVAMRVPSLMNVLMSVLTWHWCGKLNVCPWFDQVDTKPNPVDGN